MGNGRSRTKTGLNQKGNDTKRLKKEMQVQQGQMTQILFLGSGESGKSTIVKQAVIQYGSGFEQKERVIHVKKITRNLIKGAANVFLASKAVGFPIQDPKVREAGMRICKEFQLQDIPGSGVECLNDQIVQDIRTLWENAEFQETFKNSHLFQLEDTWVDFVKKLDNYPATWGGPNWLPDNDDMLRARTMTVGFNSIDITLDNKQFRLIDVGGQRSERRKWMNLFQDVDAVIFVTALSEYNQTLYESKGVSRLQESLTLFNNYSGMPDFKNSAFMLFLNKFDLFKIKYYKDGMPLQKPYDDPEIPEPPKREDEEDEECKLALTWFKDLFLRESRRNVKEIYTHVTTALDERNVKFVLQSCKDHIFTRHLVGAGMMGNLNDLSFHRE